MYGELNRTKMEFWFALHKGLAIYLALVEVGYATGDDNESKSGNKQEALHLARDQFQ